MRKRPVKAFVIALAFFVSVFLLARSVPAAPPRPLLPSEFEEVAPQGFGDRQNNGAWSMEWWDEKLYVGTVRSWFCWTWAFAARTTPFLDYPPDDPDLECAPDPVDLPLQAEIWRYTPETETWERVYQSPNDVEIPGHPGRYTGRDIGFRGMTVWEEPDGSEALFVGGATSYLLWPPTPPPNLLRSEHGDTFEPVPQDPGTLLGELGHEQTSFRGMVAHKGRLYVLNGEIQGQGAVLESEDPAAGNDNFRWITPQGMEVFELLPYNGSLYLGLADPSNGYAVVRTDASGPLPYTYTPVVTNGGFRQPRPSPSVVSMFIYGGRLYVGTDKPTELVRINPDDSWDLIMGTPRETPDGWKYPLSGLDSGFNWPFTAHIWRMAEHEGMLYVGTLDQSTRWRRTPGMDERIGWQYGFDLYASSDGQHFSPVTVDGFGDKFQNGIRTLASTPHGLFVGTSSFWYGLRIWRGNPGEVHTAYLPLTVVGLSGDGSGLSNAEPAGRPQPSVPTGSAPVVASESERRDRANSYGLPGLSRRAPYLEPPARLEVEIQDGSAVLSWDRPPGAARFRVFRSGFVLNRDQEIPDLDPDTWVPQPYVEVGATDRFFWVDEDVSPDRPYQYYVLAGDANGMVSSPSNIVRAPSLAPTVSFASIERAIAFEWKSAHFGSGSITAAVYTVLKEARSDVRADNFSGALRRLGQLRSKVETAETESLASWQREDLDIQIAKLMRRARLAEAGVISISDLE